MMGRRKQHQGQFFYEFRLDDVVPDDHLVRKIRGVLDLSWGLCGARAVLLGDRSAFDRPGADDTDAHHRLCFRDPVGAAALSRGSGQLGLSMVLRFGA